MNLLFSIAIGALFAGGILLLLKHDLLRVVAGIILISNSVTLFLMSARLSSGEIPIHPIAYGASVTDPVVQALTLTAIVITFGVVAILIGLVYRIYTSHGTIDLDELAEREEQDQWLLEAGQEVDDR